MASGSQIRPLGLAISRKQLGRTGSRSTGQPRPPPRRPIRGQIFWEPLYKPQLRSQLFPGKRSASRSPAAGFPCGAGTGARGRSEQGGGQGRQLGLKPTPTPSLGSHWLAERHDTGQCPPLCVSVLPSPRPTLGLGPVPGNTNLTPNTFMGPRALPGTSGPHVAPAATQGPTQAWAGPRNLHFKPSS